jgi:hypothetical protein
MEGGACVGAGGDASGSVCSLGLELNILSPSTAASRRAMPMPRPMGPRTTVPKPAPARDEPEPDGSPTNVESGGSQTEGLDGSTISTRSIHTPSPPTPRRGSDNRSESPSEASEAALLAQIYNARGVEVEVERATTKVLRLRPSVDFRPSWADASSASVMGEEGSLWPVETAAALGSGSDPLPSLPQPRPRAPLPLILGSGPSLLEAIRLPSSGKAEDLLANPLADGHERRSELISSRSNTPPSRSETPPSRHESSPPTSRSHTPTSSALFSVEEVEEKVWSHPNPSPNASPNPNPVYPSPSPSPNPNQVWSQESAAAPTEPTVEDEDADLMQVLLGLGLGLGLACRVGGSLCRTRTPASGRSGTARWS